MARLASETATIGKGALAAPAVVVRARRARTFAFTPYLFLAIPLILYAMWVIGPTFATFWMSLTNSDGITQADFIGLENYQRLVTDRVFWISFWNNVRWLLAFILVPTLAGLGLALLLNGDHPGSRFFKAGFFSPMILSSVVIANVWSWMYFPEGLINTALALLGYDGQPIGWLADYNLVTWAIIAAGIWRQIGYVMLLYLAGLKSVDTALVDAARTDGAGEARTFWDIVLPQLRPVTVIVVVISIIDALRAFDLVNLMTRGGPANRSNVLANQMYIEAFNNYQMGYGAAIAAVLCVITMLFIFPYLRHQVRREEGE